jgi:hypothetical protein
MIARVVLFLVSFQLIALPAMAGFGLGDLLVGSSKGSESSHQKAHVKQVVFESSVALDMYIEAQTLLLIALGEKEELAARTATIELVQSGDVSKKANENKIKRSEVADEILRKHIEDNKPLDDDQKRLATVGALRYVEAVAATVKVGKSLSRLDTASIGIFDLGSVLYLVTNIPSLASRSVSTTGALLKYLSAHDVDVSKAQKAADGLGV